MYSRAQSLHTAVIGALRRTVARIRSVGAQKLDRPANGSRNSFHVERRTIEAKTPLAADRLLHELRDVELHDRPAYLQREKGAANG